jgi:hypothetical protein
MSLSPDDGKSVEAIRARARELASDGAHRGTGDAELLAGLADGALSFEDTPDAALERCVDEFGADSVVDALTAGAGPAALVKSADTLMPIARRPPLASAVAAWWRRTPFWISSRWDRPIIPAIAATLVFLAGGAGTWFIYERSPGHHGTGPAVLTAQNRPAPPPHIHQDANGRSTTTAPTAGRSPTPPPVPTSKGPATTVAASASHDFGATTASHGPTTDSTIHPTTGPSNSAPSQPAAPVTILPAEVPAVDIEPPQSLPEQLAQTTDERPNSTSRPTTTGSHPSTTSVVAATPGGGKSAASSKTFATAGGKAMAPQGITTVAARDGDSVTKRADGHVATLHNPMRGIDVHYNLSGDRRVVVERSDHARVVAERDGPGYVQRSYVYQGHEYAQRSYYDQGHYYRAYYGRHYYQGVFLNPYFPTYYYKPAYYSWVYNPWVEPVSYAWGWGTHPWYGYYRAYFGPYPVYGSASFWLTDYIVGKSLRAAYQAGVNSQSAALSNPASLTPEVKDLIANEVRQQIVLENNEARIAANGGEPDAASSSIQRLLTDGRPHVFLIGGDLDVFDTLSTECALSGGDALQLVGQGLDAQAATLVILASKGGKECPKGDNVLVALQDLQEMQNHMRETIDQGLQELQKMQGKSGLPAAPAAAQAAPVENPLAAAAPPPPPESEVAANLKQESQEADQLEKALLVDTAPGSGLNAGKQAGPAGEQSPPAQTGVTASQTGVAAATGGRAVTGVSTAHHPVRSSKPVTPPRNPSTSKTTKPQKK